MKRTFLSLAILVLLVGAIRIPLLSIPFERDEGEYAYIAWRLDHGELPYRDWVDQKPPAIFWVFQQALNLPLEAVRAVHLMALLFSAASACAVYYLAGRFMKPFWALAAAALFAVLSADPLIQGTAANTELFMLLPLILAQIAFFSARSNDQRRIPLMLASGALTGLAVAFKQVAIVNWPFLIALYPVFAAGKQRFRQTLSFAVWSTAGLVIVWGWIAGYFLLRHGFADFVDNVFTHNLEYINTTPWSARWANCMARLETLSRSQGIVWVFAAAGFLALLRRGRIQHLLFLAGWMATSLIGVSASGYFFPHYFLQMLPPLCLAAAWAGEEFETADFWKNVPAFLRRATLGLSLWVLPVFVLYPFLFDFTPAQAVEKIYRGYGFAEMRQVGQTIAQMTRPDDRVFIFGADPEVLFYARRVSATRYIFLFPLYGQYRDVRQKQIAAANEISASQPAVILYSPNEWFYKMGDERYLTQWTRSYVHDNFLVNSYLTIDRSAAVHLVPVNNKPDPQQIFGALYVRRPK